MNTIIHLHTHTGVILLKLNMTKNKEWTGLNTRIPSDIARELAVLCEITDKSMAQIVAHAIEHYMHEVKQINPPPAMQIDRFAWGLNKQTKKK